MRLRLQSLCRQSAGWALVAALLPGFAGRCGAITPDQVLVLANAASPLSRAISEYYARARQIPAAQVLALPMPDREEITRQEYLRTIEAPLAQLLKRRGWADRILVIATTSGVPLKIRGSSGGSSDAASVDSELAALYPVLKGRPHAAAGPLANPFFGKNREMRHPDDELYLVARLSGYTFADVRSMIDRAIRARNRGVVVLDLKSYDLDDGNSWLKDAAALAGRKRAVLDESTTVLQGIRDVIGYASWGSNDPNRKERDLHLSFLPGAVVTEYVSTNGRTMAEPPESWRLGTWGDKSSYFAGSPQSLSADALRQGATAATGHVYEPYLQFTPRPQILFQNYLAGRTLGESFYASIPALSWMNILLGDPLCRLAG